jgi:pimeloyl-ACP methyl ester carboxylesterase
MSVFAIACPAALASGPPLQATAADLAESLHCSPAVRGATRAPVLLVPGTTLTPEEFTWNYEPALAAAGIPWCAVEPPGAMMADIQFSAEYVVHAIRAMRRMSGRPVAIIGHSQGGMIGRWALKYWPDLRRKVDDLVGLAPSNHGTSIAAGICVTGCAAAIHQQRADSAFLAALNAGPETFAGISYTNAYSAYDEVVVPNNGSSPSSALTTGDGDISNVSLQDVCPLDVAEHLATGTYDAVAAALAFDAIAHAGPAEPARLDAAVCTAPFMPGVDPLTFPADFGAVGQQVAKGLADAPQIPAEPPLRCYVTDACPATVPARCVVPALTGKRVRRARVVLRRAGCRLGRVRGRRGRVVRQAPRAGAQRKAGTRVKIRVR